MHPPLKTSDKKLEEEYEAVHRIFAAVQTPFELLCNRLLNLTFLNKHSCQENTLSSVEIYQFFQTTETKKPAQEVHLATSKTGK